MALNKKIQMGAVFLFASALVIWGVFYYISAGNIQRANESRMQQVSEQIVDRLENELLGLESIAYTLADNPSVQAFAAEENAVRFHERSAAVDDVVGAMPSDLLSHVVIYNGQGIWANFVGGLGNTAAGAFKKLLEEAPVPYYKAVTLESVRYISYTYTIQSEEAAIGTLLFLIEEERLLGLFSNYVATDDLQISLAENGRVVASSDPALLEQPIPKTNALSSRKIGFAPFEVLVTTSEGYLSGISRDYAVAALLTAVLFVGLLAAVIRTANRHLFRPMLHVVRDVEALGGDSGMARLTPTGETAFDGLVNQVNGMLCRLEERNRALLQTQTELQKAEMERQNALIISLKKQINAHFTVNVLNDIKALAEQGEKEKAAEVSDGLSHLLRYANDEDAFINGMDELFVLEKYVSVMGIRYGNTFSAEFDWDDRLIHAQFPRMLLQPLVENAIVHGLAPARRAGTLKVTGLLDRDRVVIEVADDGVGMAPERLRRVLQDTETVDASAWSATGIDRIALANIRWRMRSYYSGGFTMSVDSREGTGTLVRLIFPMHPDRPLPPGLTPAG